MIILDTKDKQKLIDNNSAEPFADRNKAVILAHLYWGLTPTESSLVSVKDIMNDRGQLYSIWVLPDEYAQSGHAREIRTDGVMITAIENYLSWLDEFGCSKSKSKLYRGLLPDSKLFVNDRGEGYAVSKRNGKNSYVPRSMHDFLKRMISNTDLVGVTPASLRYTFINDLNQSGVKTKELMEASGYRSKQAIEKKLAYIDVQQALTKVFKYVRV